MKYVDALKNVVEHNFTFVHPMLDEKYSKTNNSIYDKNVDLSSELDCNSFHLSLLFQV